MKLVAADSAEVLRTMAGRLHQLGMVRESFQDALLAREASSPTGLPLAGRKLALPHADPDQERAVEVVALLALTDHESAQQALVRFLERSQDADFLDRLCACPDPGALCALLESEVGA